MDSDRLFRPHPGLSDELNRNIAQSEVEGGVYVRDLPSNTALEVATQSRSYYVVHRGQGDFIIWGHPVFCPQRVRASISGSNWGGSSLKVGFIGRGMHLEFRHPEYRMPIVTSRMREVREVSNAAVELTAAALA